MSEPHHENKNDLYNIVVKMSVTSFWNFYVRFVKYKAISFW